MRIIVRVSQKINRKEAIWSAVVKIHKAWRILFSLPFLSWLLLQKKGKKEKFFERTKRISCKEITVDRKRIFSNLQIMRLDTQERNLCGSGVS